MPRSKVKIELLILLEEGQSLLAITVLVYFPPPNI